MNGLLGNSTDEERKLGDVRGAQYGQVARRKEDRRSGGKDGARPRDMLNKQRVNPLSNQVAGNPRCALSKQWMARAFHGNRKMLFRAPRGPAM